MSLHPYIDRINQQTQNDPGIYRERLFVDSFFENWVGEFLHPYGNDLYHAGLLDKSLFYCYLTGQATNFHWYAHSLYNGAYTVVYRELRCILEGLFIAYKIDHQHRGLNLDRKLIILQQAENDPEYIGRKVFRSSGFRQWEQYYNSCYKSLSSYVHLSYSKVASRIHEVRSSGFPEALDFTYVQDDFRNVVHIWQQIAWLAVDMATELALPDNIRISPQKDMFNLPA